MRQDASALRTQVGEPAQPPAGGGRGFHVRCAYPGSPVTTRTRDATRRPARGASAAAGRAMIPSSSSSTKKARANGESAVRRGAASQSTCSRTARAIGSSAREVERVLVEREQLGRRARPRAPSPARRSDATDSVLAAREHLVVDRQPARAEDQVDEHVAVPRLQQPLLRRVLGAHAGAARAPAARARRPRARSIRSRSLPARGPPRAQHARLPPSRNGISASRSAGGRALASPRCRRTARVSPMAATRTRAGPAYRGADGASAGRGTGRAPSRGAVVRVAAAGDMHCRRASRERGERGVRASCAAEADLLLLAGDLTTHGEPEQGAVLAEACRDSGCRSSPSSATTTGTSNRRDELVAALEDGGHHACSTRDRRDLRGRRRRGRRRRREGLRRRLPRLAPAGLRRAAAARGLRRDHARGRGARRGLRAIALCPLRIVLLHYAPDARRRWSASPRRSGRSSAPTGWPRRSPSTSRPRPARPRPRGHFEGRIGTVPVLNVSVPVLGRDFWELELRCRSGRRPRSTDPAGAAALRGRRGARFDARVALTRRRLLGAAAGTAVLAGCGGARRPLRPPRRGRRPSPPGWTPLVGLRAPAIRARPAACATSTPTTWPRTRRPSARRSSATAAAWTADRTPTSTSTSPRWRRPRRGRRRATSACPPPGRLHGLDHDGPGAGVRRAGPARGRRGAHHGARPLDPPRGDPAGGRARRRLAGPRGALRRRGPGEGGRRRDGARAHGGARARAPGWWA